MGQYKRKTDSLNRHVQNELLFRNSKIEDPPRGHHNYLRLNDASRWWVFNCTISEPAKRNAPVPKT